MKEIKQDYSIVSKKETPGVQTEFVVNTPDGEIKFTLNQTGQVAEEAALVYARNQAK